MTRQEIGNRVRDELSAWGEDREVEPVTPDDLDALTVALDATLDECRGFLEQQFGSDKETT